MRARGLGGDAAQAGAALARALLLQGRLDEAEAIAQEAEVLAGSDLKAGIHWRDVRALAALRRGDIETALALARESVELASATDVLLLLADARLTLATALHAAGDTAAADAETRRAVEACDAKGITVFLQRIRRDVDGARGELDRSQQDRSGQPDATEWFANAAWRAEQQQVAAANERSWESYVETLAPDFEYHDNRLGLQIHAAGDERLDSARVFFALDNVAWEHSLVAARDDRLALTRNYISFVDGAAGRSEVETLTITECDAEGRVVASVVFDADDMTSAFDELDRRHVALGGNPLSATLRHAVAARDWELLASVFAPDCTFVDHRTAGWGVVGPHEFVDYQRVIGELAPDTRIWIDHSRSQGNVHLSTGRVSGTQTGGGWEIAYVTVGVTSPDGRSTTVEVYNLADVAIARARFDELVAAANEPFGNSAWRTAAAQVRAINVQDWEAFVATLAPDGQVDDRRKGLVLVYRGREATELHRTSFTLDHCRMERTLLATRGEHLALVETTVTFEDRHAGEAEVVCLVVLEVDDRGHLVTQVTLDADRLETAYKELDARYVALGGVGGEVSGTYLTPDPGVFDSSFVSIDRRHAGYGRLTREPFVEMWRQGIELAPDVRIWVDHLRSSHGIRLVVSREVGTHDGGAWELPVVAVSAFTADGKVEWVETYDIEDLAVARARYEEAIALRGTTTG
jgi:hypothetical protein